MDELEFTLISFAARMEFKFIGIALVAISVKYFYSWCMFRKIMMDKRRGQNVIPPLVPDIIPRIGNAISFVRDPTGLVKHIV
jgi:hypothetical protein